MSAHCNPVHALSINATARISDLCCVESDKLLSLGLLLGCDFCRKVTRVLIEHEADMLDAIRLLKGMCLKGAKA